jgi:hypothetical protein
MSSCGNPQESSPEKKKEKEAGGRFEGKNTVVVVVIAVLRVVSTGGPSSSSRSRAMPYGMVEVRWKIETRPDYVARATVHPLGVVQKREGAGGG